MQAQLLTANGRGFPLAAPAPADVDFAVIGEALAKQCRFAGHTTQFYSTAQHAMLVAALLPAELRLYGLLHEAHDAYVGTLTSPFRQALAELSGDALQRLSAPIRGAIFRAAGLRVPVPAEVEAKLRKAERVVLATELRDLLPEAAHTFGALPAPLPKLIRPLPWASAMEAFHLRRLDYARWHPMHPVP